MYVAIIASINPASTSVKEDYFHQYNIYLEIIPCMNHDSIVLLHYDFSLIPLTLALCRFPINTAPIRRAPKRPEPRCPCAQTTAPKRRRPEVTYPYYKFYKIPLPLCHISSSIPLSFQRFFINHASISATVFSNSYP